MVFQISKSSDYNEQTAMSTRTERAESITPLSGFTGHEGLENIINFQIMCVILASGMTF